MNFDFSDDQKYLREEARRFLHSAWPLGKLHARMKAPDRSDRVLWQSIAGQGWLGVAIPERYGGVGLGRLELCIVAEEMGRVLAPLPFVSTAGILAEALLVAGSEAQKAELLPRIAEGTLIGCLATSEGPGRTDPASVAAIVADGKLTGTKLPVTDGGSADVALVLAQEGGTTGVYLAMLDGVERAPLATLDPTRETAALIFADTPATRLGGVELLDALRDRAAVLIAFEQIGGADRALEMALGYASERYAFGRPIGSYQAIKHKLADIYVKNELARANAYYAAWAYATGDAGLPAAASAARIAASDAFWFAARENLHVHGGMGYTSEADCHLFYRRARQLSLVIGSPSTWKERLMAQIENRAAAA
ncbi:MAG: acyl-CoA dehydrogenase family protein [Pseudomonadota bacterium]